MRRYVNMAAALNDKSSAASSVMARFDAEQKRTDLLIAALMARGLSRHDAWAELLVASRVAS